MLDRIGQAGSLDKVIKIFGQAEILDIRVEEPDMRMYSLSWQGEANKYLASDLQELGNIQEERVYFVRAVLLAHLLAFYP